VTHRRELEVAEHTFRRSPSNDSAVAMAEMAIEAFGTTAISSGSAPSMAAARVRRRSTSATQSSHGEPPACHDSTNALSAAATADDSAPCEQLLT